MRVKELVEALRMENQESEVFLAIDAEGNGLKRIWGISGEHLDFDDTSIEFGDEEDDDYKKLPKCIVVWPE